MKLKLVIGLMILGLFLVGCQSEVETNGPSVEQPAVPNNGEVSVIEDVIIPSHEPEPIPEPEPIVVPTPVNYLEQFEHTEYFAKGDPEVGEVLTRRPRKVDVIFKYPLTTGTEVQLWDKHGVVRYDNDNTVIAGEDSVVAITYFDELLPGIYKVMYHAEFINKPELSGDGFYYFEVE